jgi:hypothetical protein
VESRRAWAVRRGPAASSPPPFTGTVLLCIAPDFRCGRQLTTVPAAARAELLRVGMGRRSSAGYAPTNAHIKYTYSVSDPSEVTNRRSWGPNGIKGDGLGFDGGAPTSQRGGVERKWVRGARIGACSHREKFVQALDNSLGDGWGNTTGESSRSALLRQPTRCLTPYAVTLDESRSEPHLHAFPRVPGQRTSDASATQPSLGPPEQLRLSVGAGRPGSSLTSTFELQYAEEQAALSRERASTAAAAVRQAIWQRNRKRPCVPTADDVAAAVSSNSIQPWSGSSVVVDPLWQALANADGSFGGGAADSSAAAAAAGRRPALSTLAAEGLSGLAKMLAWANCDARLLTQLMHYGVQDAEQLLNVSDAGFASAGLKPAERRRLIALVKELHYESDGMVLDASADSLLKMRGKRDQKNATGRAGRGTKSLPKEVWRRPKKVRKRISFARHLILKIMNLPRQARDKHRESTQKRERRFRTDDGSRLL